MSGKIIIGVFGLVAMSHSSAWQWRLMGGMIAVWGFASAISSFRHRPRGPIRRPSAHATTPAKKEKAAPKKLEKTPPGRAGS